MIVLTVFFTSFLIFYNNSIIIVPSLITMTDNFEKSSSDHFDHAPISIDGNDDFITQATSEGWPGDGSKKNPYVISGLMIDTSEDLIGIRNTNL